MSKIRKQRFQTPQPERLLRQQGAMEYIPDDPMEEQRSRRKESLLSKQTERKESIEESKGGLGITLETYARDIQQMKETLNFLQYKYVKNPIYQKYLEKNRHSPSLISASRLKGAKHLRATSVLGKAELEMSNKSLLRQVKQETPNNSSSLRSKLRLNPIPIPIPPMEQSLSNTTSRRKYKSAEHTRPPVYLPPLSNLPNLSPPEDAPLTTYNTQRQSPTPQRISYTTRGQGEALAAISQQIARANDLKPRIDTFTWGNLNVGGEYIGNIDNRENRENRENNSQNTQNNHNRLNTHNVSIGLLNRPSSLYKETSTSTSGIKISARITPRLGGVKERGEEERRTTIEEERDFQKGNNYRREHSVEEGALDLISLDAEINYFRGKLKYDEKLSAESPTLHNQSGPEIKEDIRTESILNLATRRSPSKSKLMLRNNSRTNTTSPIKYKEQILHQFGSQLKNIEKVACRKFRGKIRLPSFVDYNFNNSSLEKIDNLLVLTKSGIQEKSRSNISYISNASNISPGMKGLKEYVNKANKLGFKRNSNNHANNLKNMHIDPALRAVRAYKVVNFTGVKNIMKKNTSDRHIKQSHLGYN